MYNYRVATVWGIPIKINISLIVFLPVLAWIIGGGEQIEFYAGLVDGLAGTSLDVSALQDGSTPWVVGSAAAVGLFLSVAVHELGHAAAARRYGIETSAITLWILGGLASLDRIPKEPGRELVIALAGPAASVVTGVACYAALVALPASTTPAVVFVLGWLAITNITLTVFNLVPAFPMDGGRVLRAFLARNRPYVDATRIAARIGTIFALLFAILGIFAAAPMLLLLALFIYSAANGESRVVALEAMLDGFVVRDVYQADRPTVDADVSLDAFAQHVLEDRQDHHVVRDRSGRVVGLVGLDALREHGRDDGVTVGDAADTDLPTVDLDTPAFDALRAMEKSPYAFVADDGELVSVVERDDFASLLELTGLSKKDRFAQ
ncbi:site-2 protease family protein [Halorubellus sp. JP-L1]|uniref:site-2 protease family protein n=1 Tax=Halorubellus sp. JP-L1 TaxID=2715753 RepID=UPI00140C9442|nr:site-2 protease family protein [Halorubellus sp. JP-L1]NHN43140.1 site-2 protease family protein [Halorubellus sp. JP-L1]